VRDYLVNQLIVNGDEAVNRVVNYFSKRHFCS
jgi:hypothetical protein